MSFGLWGSWSFFFIFQKAYASLWLFLCLLFLQAFVFKKRLWFFQDLFENFMPRNNFSRSFNFKKVSHFVLNLQPLCCSSSSWSSCYSLSPLSSHCSLSLELSSYCSLSSPSPWLLHYCSLCPWSSSCCSMASLVILLLFIAFIILFLLIITITTILGQRNDWSLSLVLMFVSIQGFKFMGASRELKI